jgi:hypothetical protein
MIGVGDRRVDVGKLHQQFEGGKDLSLTIS